MLASGQTDEQGDCSSLSDQLRRKTWRDWVADPGSPPLVTRAEVLAKAERLGLDVDLRTLRYWESEGVLPAPHVEKNGTPALYPWWIIDLVYLVRRLQDERQSLDRIRVEVRERVEQLSHHRFNDASAEAIRQVVLGDRQPWEPDDLIGGLIIFMGMMFPTFARDAKRIANTYASRAGHSSPRVSLLIETDNGETAVIPLDSTAPDPDS